MSMIETDAEPGWIREAWQRKSGDLSLKGALKPGNRGLTAVALFSLAGTGLLLSWSVTEVASGDLISGVVIGLLTLFYGWNGLIGLDRLDCRLRESHECRDCKEETERWTASGVNR